MNEVATSDRRADARTAIVAVAAKLLQEEGASGVTTRRVAEAAGIQAPTLYRLFGDKDGLLDAVAEHVFATFVSTKVVAAHSASVQDIDPLDDLRLGWDLQIAFAVSNPALFRLSTDPVRSADSPAAQAGMEVLATRVRRLAIAGRLRVSERRAVDLIHAGGTGAVLAILSAPLAERDPGVADAMLEAVLGQILVEPPARAGGGISGPTVAAVTLRAAVPDLDMLSAPERELLTEWLDRAVGTLQDR